MKIFHKIEKKYFIILGICVVFFLGYLLLGRIFYEENDDFALNLIANGTYTPHSEYLVFNNIIYGYILKILYKITGRVNWYLFVMLFMNFVSITLLCLMVSKKTILPISIGLTVFINILLDYDFYNCLQFTKNAALYSMIGFLILYFVMIEDISKKMIPIGIILMIFGALVRFDSFKAVLPFGLCLLIVEMFGSPIKKYLKKLIPLGISLLMIFSFQMFHEYFYNSQPEWNYALQYNHQRSLLLDYGVPPYEENKKLYKSLDIELLDLNMLKSWAYSNFDKFTLKRLEMINNNKKAVSYDLSLITKSFSNIYAAIRNHLLPAMWLIGLLVLLFLDTKSCFLYLLLSGVICAEYILLSSVNRVIWRVVYMIWLSFFIIFYPFILNRYSKKINDLSFDKTYKKYVYYVIILCLLVSNGLNLLSNTFNDKDLGKDYFLFFHNIKQQKDKVYVAAALTFGCIAPATKIYRINRRYKDVYRNTLFLGGWSVPSPLNNRIDKSILKNPVKSLIKSDVYFACNSGSKDTILKYLQKEYSKKVKIKYIETIENIQIWKYYID